jgi:hypothetical protein
MEGNSFYQLHRRKSPGSDVVVCWTGDGWSDDTNDGVLFRHAGSAAKFAKSRKWDVRAPGAFHPNRMAVEVALVTPELVLREVKF